MATKTVYQTDPTSGIYLFTTQANELALARGFQCSLRRLRGFAPELAAGEAARWEQSSSAWTVVEDHRGERLYLVKDGTEYQTGSDVDIDGEPASYQVGEKCPPG